MGLITLGKNFCHWTISVVIAGHLAKTKNKIWRTFWSILLVVTIIAFCLHSASNIIEYLSYEKTTVIRLFSMSSAPFPAVTICNLNPFKQSALNQSATISNLISAYKYTLDQRTANNAATSISKTRKKRQTSWRQTCSQDFTAQVNAPSESSPQDYTIYGCGTTYNITFDLCGNNYDKITLTNISKSDFDANKDAIEKGIYLCFHDDYCNKECNAWESGLTALTNFTQCASANFPYPGNTGDFNIMAKIAEGYADECAKSDRNCNLGFYKKPSTKYPGNYWYTDCLISYAGGSGYNQTYYMEGCDPNYVYKFVTISAASCTDRISKNSGYLSQTMDDTDCATTCGVTCPYAYPMSYIACSIAVSTLCDFYVTCPTTTSLLTATTDFTTILSTTTPEEMTEGTTFTTTYLTTEEPTTTTKITTEKSTATEVTIETTTEAKSTTGGIDSTPFAQTTTTEETTFAEITSEQSTTNKPITIPIETTTEAITTEYITSDSSSSLLSSTNGESTTTEANIEVTTTPLRSSTAIISTSTTTKASTATFSYSTQHNTSSVTTASQTSTSSSQSPSIVYTSTSTKPTSTSQTFSTVISSTSSAILSSSLTSKASTVLTSSGTTKALTSLPTEGTSHAVSQATSSVQLISTTPKITTQVATTFLTKETTKSTIQSTRSYKTTTMKSNLESTQYTTKNAFDSTFDPSLTSGTTDDIDTTSTNVPLIESSTWRLHYTPTSTAVNEATDMSFKTSSSSTDNSDSVTSQITLGSTATSSQGLSTESYKTTTIMGSDSTTKDTGITSIFLTTLPDDANMLGSTSEVFSTMPTEADSERTLETTTETKYPVTTTLKYATKVTTKTSATKPTTKKLDFLTSRTALSMTTPSSDSNKSGKTTKYSTLSSTKSQAYTSAMSKPSSLAATSSTKTTQLTSMPLGGASTTPSTNPSASATLISLATSKPPPAYTSIYSTTQKLGTTSLPSSGSYPNTIKQIQTFPTSLAPSTSTGFGIDLDYLSKIYKLNSSQSPITIETNAQQALITVAASLSDEEKEALGYKIGDLIQTCIIDGVPCNIERDFSQTYDVDYGYCYTFNYELFYNTTQMGANYGLKMVVISDVNEYLATSSEQGIKVVVHYQDQAPFPNVDGYRSATGKGIDLRVTYGIVSRLDAPYGSCNNLDKLKEMNQPFYFNGTYTVEGCYRSCFQKKVSKACNCADPRFPLPTDFGTSFCKMADTVKYACYEKYIQDNGDYYNVEDCSCAISCDDITYDASIYYSSWPYGTFFYQALCTNTTFLNGTTCQEYYRKNAVLVQVSYARLGYESIVETPVLSGFDLFNNLAGNTGLWIGFTMVTAAEILLIFIQICLWIFTKRLELPEVPSCRRRNYTEDGDLDESKEGSVGSTAAILGGATGLAGGSALGFVSLSDSLQGSVDGINKPRHLVQPKAFNNYLRNRMNPHLTPENGGLYESIRPINIDDKVNAQLIAPIPVHSATLEHPPDK